MSDRWIFDTDLTPEQRRYLAEFLTPRTGSGDRIVWPVHELPEGVKWPI